MFNLKSFRVENDVMSTGKMFTMKKKKTTESKRKVEPVGNIK